MPVSPAEKANATALQSAQARLVSSHGVSSHIDEKLTSTHYGAQDRASLEKLKADLARADSETNAEIAARQNLAAAYASSTFPNQAADPAVKKSQKALADVRKSNKPVLHHKQNLVNGVCQPCLVKEVDSIMDCETPYHVPYKSGGGPRYKDCHDHTLAAYPGWNDLLKSKVKTPSERDVLCAMSANEGDLDSVQAYDGQIISAGAMQKTVTPDGQGELPIQLRQFRDDPANKAVYDRVLGSKGYSVEKNIVGQNKDGSPKYGDQDTLYYTDPTDPKAKPITGPALNALIQNDRDRWPDTMGPFRELGRTPEFQRKQILDFNDRLVTAVGKDPAGYSHPIGSYVTSQYGSALVLDQSVNAPGYMQKDFGRALDKFYDDNPDAPADPSTWTPAQRAAYEPQISNNYAGIRRGTDMPARAEKLGNQSLSSAPGTLTFPSHDT